jgi:CRISPR-associated endonuclease/helicase Cas3
MPSLARPGQLLTDHLRGVAGRARTFGDTFQSGEWSYLAGLWHDLGKFREEFQRRLAGESIQVDHSGVGAAHAKSQPSPAAIALAFAIAGHHGGLPNLLEKPANCQRSPLKERLDRSGIVLDAIRSTLPIELTACTVPALPQRLNAPRGDARAKRRFEFWTRFLYSALVDADYLDTESAIDPQRASLRSGQSGLEGLRDALEQEYARLAAKATSKSPVNHWRREIAEDCLSAAAIAPGFFSLTAPTGSGKTLAALRFALHHALRNDLRRVIVVLPYTSIIEQNAAVYRDLFGAGNTLEHHSNFDLEDYQQTAGREETSRHMLACENWDAPIVVTTTVQFFESLFGNKPSRCRKLHNIAGSVVILDEVQTLPAHFLPPILDGLNELVSGYRCCIVLSTATPPALARRPRFEMGIENVREILPDPGLLARQFSRVRYRWPSVDEPPRQWPELAAELAAHPQVLAIVHRRQDARELASALRPLCPDGAVFHLSGFMCPAHRSHVIAACRARLDDRDGLPCRVVSTQLVEAGVDFDFPVLYRALAGLDSVVQAAGRCNREGLRAEGLVHVFRAPTQPPAGVLRSGLQIMEQMLARYGGAMDPTDPAVCAEYFSQLYAFAAQDTKGIQALREGFNFESVALAFQLIEDGAQQSIIVPYRDGADRIAQLNVHAPAMGQLRALQPFTVRVHRHWVAKLLSAGALAEPLPGVLTLNSLFANIYSEDYGLDLSGELLADVSQCVI